MVQDKILKIVELHKEIKKLVDEMNDETISDRGVYWSLFDAFSLGGREDIYNAARALNIEAETVKRDRDIYPTETRFTIGGLKFYCLNTAKESE